ncbi:GerAB/ArcD/ProY family transporter [Paenibacillus methanolicus]|uniref:Spore germination protein (Amino acid permease) n=1 Tax=Paenibacillus methanolicus TaxID=582686 RepID=A0A5S5C3P5_9BACL|nr:endospore germination permease [Paenibacillus methanolicus]TYP73927.1 spore germination protein (amino acid permease) [Paenibacillus methanolicus]
MRVQTFGVWPLFFMLMLSVGLANHVILLPLILNDAGRDAWLCALIALAASLPWIYFVIHGTLKRTGGKPLARQLFKRLPKPIAFLLLLPMGLQLTMTSFQAYAETAAWTTTTYLPATPPLVVLICLIALIGLGVWSGIRAIAIMSTMLLPTVVFLGDFVMTANMPDKNYSYLLPIMEHGPDGVLRGSLLALGSLSELFILLLVKHHLTRSLQSGHLIGLIVFLTLLTVGPAIGAVTEFGPVEAAKLRYPAFAQWRLVTIGRYIEHLDFFAIFQWVAGSFVRMSLSLYVVMELLPLRRQAFRAAVLAVICVLFIVAAKVMSHFMFDYRVLTRIIFLSNLLVTAGVTFVLWLLSFNKLREEGNDAGSEHHAYNG